MHPGDCCVGVAGESPWQLIFFGMRLFHPQTKKQTNKQTNTATTQTNIQTQQHGSLRRKSVAAHLLFRIWFFHPNKQRNKLIGIMLFHPQTNKQTNQHSNNTNKRTNKATTDTNNMGVSGEGKVRGSSSPN